MALMTPKNYNRIYLMNLGTPEEPDWKPITVGISATEVEVEEEAGRPLREGVGRNSAATAALN